MRLESVNGNKVEFPQKLRVLAVADVVEPRLYTSGIKDWIGRIDLLVSCGDLPPGYLDFLTTSLSTRLVHVLGNHCYERHAPWEQEEKDTERFLGAFDLNGQVVEYSGLILAGMEGSPLYNNGPHQYTEQQAAWNLLRLSPALLVEKLRTGRYLDILVTHTPPRGIQDGTDLPHKGFKSLLPFIERFKPTLLLHGHSHNYDPLQPMRSKYGGTEIINVYGHVLLELVRDRDTAWSISAGQQVHATD